MTIITLPATGTLPTTPTLPLTPEDSWASFDVPKIKSMDLSEAVCPQTDPDAFHATYNISDEQLNAILAVCSVCTIAEQCLDAALQQPKDEDWGIWGGTTRPERKAIRKNPEKREEFLQRLTDIRKDRYRVSSRARRPVELAEAS